MSAPRHRVEVLDARDAEIMRHLQAALARLVDIGRYRKSWTAADVDRVTRRWLYPPPAAELAPVVPLRRPDTVWTPPESPESPESPARTRPVSITPAQQLVLTQLCRGRMNGEIAAALYMSVDTVKAHMQALNAAFGTRNRLQLVVLVLTGRVHVTVRPDPRRTLS